MESEQRKKKNIYIIISLPQEVADNVPRIKKRKDQAPYIAFNLVALVTILQHSTCSRNDEDEDRSIK